MSDGIAEAMTGAGETSKDHTRNFSMLNKYATPVLEEDRPSRASVMTPDMNKRRSVDTQSRLNALRSKMKSQNEGRTRSR